MQNTKLRQHTLVYLLLGSMAKALPPTFRAEPWLTATDRDQFLPQIGFVALSRFVMVRRVKLPGRTGAETETV